MYHDILSDDQQPLSADELRILKILLEEHLVKLNENGLNIESAISDQLDVTNERVVKCLRIIDQKDKADILDKKQGEKITN